jgi:hypothetical protein
MFLANTDFSKATSNLKSEAIILEALDILHREYENGETLRVSVFSQITSPDWDEENDEIWRDVAMDLGNKEIIAAMVQGNQGFIRNWHEYVIFEEDEEGQEANSMDCKDNQSNQSNHSRSHDPWDTPPEERERRTLPYGPFSASWEDRFAWIHHYSTLTYWHRTCSGY